MEEARKYFSRRDMIYLPLASKSLVSIDRGWAISIVDILLANSGIMPDCLFLPRFPVCWKLKNCDTCHGNLPLRHVFTGGYLCLRSDLYLPLQHRQKAIYFKCFIFVEKTISYNTSSYVEEKHFLPKDHPLFSNFFFKFNTCTISYAPFISPIQLLILLRNNSNKFYVVFTKEPTSEFYFRNMSA